MTDRTTTTDPHAELALRLNEVRNAVLAKFVYMTDAELDLAALWIAHAHAIKAFQTTPRLGVTSQSAGCGKSTLAKLLTMLCPSTSYQIDPTQATYVAEIQGGAETVGIDECDRLWGRAGKNVRGQLIGLINAGYDRDAPGQRRMAGGGEAGETTLFMPVFLAGIGQLPSTITDRCISIKLAKPPANVSLPGYDARIHKTAVAAYGASLGQAVRALVAELATAWPERPSGMVLRDGQLWDPILAIGDAAGPEWSERARAAYRAMVLGEVSTPSDSPGDQLRNDVAEIAERPEYKSRTTITTAEVVTALKALTGRGYLREADRTLAMDVATALGLVAVEPKKVGPSNKRLQGYVLAELRNPGFSSV